MSENVRSQKIREGPYDEAVDISASDESVDTQGEKDKQSAKARPLTQEIKPNQNQQLQAVNKSITPMTNIPTQTNKAPPQSQVGFANVDLHLIEFILGDLFT